MIRALSTEGKGLSELSENLPTYSNRSSSPKQIERNYVRRFFAFDPTEKKVPDYIKQAIKVRLSNRLNAEKTIEKLFEKKLTGWEQAITPAEEVLHLLRR